MNKFARSITKWTKACDKRLNRLISYIHHTCKYKQYCYVGNTAKHADWDFFKTPILREISRIQNLLRVEHCAFFGSHTLIPTSWMCKTQTSVSHSSTESEIISLDAGLRLDGIPALVLWDLIVSVLGNTTQNHDRTDRPVVEHK